MQSSRILILVVLGLTPSVLAQGLPAPPRRGPVAEAPPSVVAGELGYRSDGRLVLSSGSRDYVVNGPLRAELFELRNSSVEFEGRVVPAKPGGDPVLEVSRVVSPRPLRDLRVVTTDTGKIWHAGERVRPQGLLRRLFKHELLKNRSVVIDGYLLENPKGGLNSLVVTSIRAQVREGTVVWKDLRVVTTLEAGASVRLVKAGRVFGHLDSGLGSVVLETLVFGESSLEVTPTPGLLGGLDATE